MIKIINIKIKKNKNNWSRNMLCGEMTKSRNVGGVKMIVARVTGAKVIGAETVRVRNV